MFLSPQKRLWTTMNQYKFKLVTNLITVLKRKHKSARLDEVQEAFLNMYIINVLLLKVVK